MSVPMRASRSPATERATCSLNVQAKNGCGTDRRMTSRARTRGRSRTPHTTNKDISLDGIACTTTKMKPSRVDLRRSDSDRRKSNLTLCFLDFPAAAPPMSTSGNFNRSFGYAAALGFDQTSSRFGGPLHKPSTSNFALMSSTTLV